MSTLPTEPFSGSPEQVSCPLMAWKANIDERSGRPLKPGVPSSLLQFPTLLVQEAARGVFHRLRMRWINYKLGQVPQVVVHTVEGSLPVPYVRRETALPRTFLDYVMIYALSCILAFFLPQVLHLYLYERCPNSRQSYAFRGVYCDVPLIVRILRTPRPGALAAEWSHLPRGRSSSKLPIPRYYGLFQLGEYHEMVLTSDNGVTLDRMPHSAELDFG